MEFSTSLASSASSVPLGETVEATALWDTLLSMLPPDLEGSARDGRALLRRRVIRSARELLQTVVWEAAKDLSLRELAGWFGCTTGRPISDVAILQRLRHCRVWLSNLVCYALQERCLDWPECPGVHLHIRDATVISRPGSQGTDWRAHLSFSLERACLENLEITSSKGAESLARFPVMRNEIYLGDRGLAFVSGLAPVLAAGAQLIVRINWQNLPLLDGQGVRVDITKWMEGINAAGDTQDAHEMQVILKTPESLVPLRLLAKKLTPEEAERARRRATRNANKKKHKVDPRTLLAAGFILLLTNLPSELWSASLVFQLYRIRWQIELHIKRLKSILHLDHLTALDPELAQTYLLGKFLIALVLDKLTELVAKQVPDWFTSLQRPISLWRLTRLLWQMITDLLAHFPSAMLQVPLSDLKRLLCDTPRRRRQKLAEARYLLSGVKVPCLS